MTERARECAGCNHWREGDIGVDPKPRRGVFRIYTILYGWRHFFACLKGHRPRFYKERTLRAWVSGTESVRLVRPAGWRRRCEDYEPREEER